MKDSDKPIVDMLTLRRDSCLVMSLLLADKGGGQDRKHGELDTGFL